MTPYAKSDGCSATTGAGAGSTPDRSGAAGVTLLLFASARLAAGTARQEMAGRDVADVLEQACRRFGPDFAAVLDRSQVWVNGEPAGRGQILVPGDELAVLPPVSGGS